VRGPFNGAEDSSSPAHVTVFQGESRYKEDKNRPWGHRAPGICFPKVAIRDPQNSANTHAPFVVDPRTSDERLPWHNGGNEWPSFFVSKFSYWADFA
jgi:hypothetical protein